MSLCNNKFIFLYLVTLRKMDSVSISNNIISIFTVFFFFILLMMLMSYSASKSMVNELEYKIAKMSQEREQAMEQQAIREIQYMEAIRQIQNVQNVETKNETSECVTKSELQSLLQLIQSQNKAISSPKQNFIKNSNVNEIYPVPVIPGGEFLKRGVISMRNVDFPYQDITTVFQRVGTIATADKNDDYVMTLYRRDIAPERDLYEYKVNDNMNGSNIEIFLDTNISLLRNGDRIIVPGFESKGEFIVKLDRQYSYIRLRPFP